MKSILHKSFKYVPAAKTDIAATFRRIQREQATKEAKAKASGVTTLHLPKRAA